MTTTRAAARRVEEEIEKMLEFLPKTIKLFLKSKYR